MKTRDIIRSITSFLFSRANRELLVFLFFFAVAGVFWLMTTLNETYEQEVRIPVSFANVPKNAVLTSGDTDTLRVTLRDKGINLLPFIYRGDHKPISVDFRRYASGTGTGSVPQSELLKMAAAVIPASTKAVAMKPERLTFYYNYGEKKRVAVRYHGTIVPEQHYFIAKTTYSPDSITIYASAEKLDSISTVYTEPVSYTDFHDTLTIEARLQKMAGVKMVPQQVRITIVTDVLTEESIDGIPIVGVNMPEGKTLRTFPAKVKVTFVTGMKNYQRLSPSDFLVVADYNEFSANPNPKCNIYLRRTPDGISRAKLEMQQVDYLIEEQD